MLGHRRTGAIWAALALTALLAAAVLAPAATAKKGKGHKGAPTLEFRGQAIIPTGTSFMGTTVGGLSSISYAGGESLSTSSPTTRPTRASTSCAPAIADGELDNDDITFTSVTTLKQPDGTPYPTGSLDPEGFTLTKHNRKAVITSEGFANRLINPWIRVYRLDGTYVRDVPVPAEFNPNAAGTQGVRLNLGFEAAATLGKHLYTGTEAALVQDGPPATLAAGSPVRILEVRPEAEHAPARVALLPDRSDRRAVHGLRRQRARRGAAARQAAPAHDGAVVLRRRAGHGEHDQALRHRAPEGRDDEQDACS